MNYKKIKKTLRDINEDDFANKIKSFKDNGLFEWVFK